eukprot:5705632-Pyramimonas_sp.AAC.1
MFRLLLCILESLFDDLSFFLQVPPVGGHARPHPNFGTGRGSDRGGLARGGASTSMTNQQHTPIPIEGSERAM